MQVRFMITVAPQGRKTKINISAHGEQPAFEGPFWVTSATVPVEGNRPHGQTSQYLAEVIAALNADFLRQGAVAAAPLPSVIAEIEGMEPLPFSEIDAGLEPDAQGGMSKFGSLPEIDGVCE